MLKQLTKFGQNLRGANETVYSAQSFLRAKNVICVYEMFKNPFVFHYGMGEAGVKYIKLLKVMAFNEVRQDILYKSFCNIFGH